MTININTKFDYMCKGSYLWEEDSGELKKLLVSILNGENEFKGELYE